MSSLTFLRKQLGVYEGHSWKSDHDDAMEVYEIEDAIAIGMPLYNCLKRKPPQGGTTVEMAIALCEFYEVWYNVSRDLLRGIEEYEAKGYAVEGAPEFKSMFVELTGMQDGVRVLRGKAAALQSGNGLSLDDAIAAIQSGSCA